MAAAPPGGPTGSSLPTPAPQLCFPASPAPACTGRGPAEPRRGRMAADRDSEAGPQPAGASTHRHDGGGEKISWPPPRGLMGQRGPSQRQRPLAAGGQRGAATRCQGNRGRARAPGSPRGHFVPLPVGSGLRRGRRACPAEPPAPEPGWDQSPACTAVSCCLGRGACCRERVVAAGAGVLPGAPCSAAEAGDEPQRFCWEMPHQKVLELLRSQAASSIANSGLAPRASPAPTAPSSLHQTWEHVPI